MQHLEREQTWRVRRQIDRHPPEEEPEADHNELRDELSRAGFGDPEIDRALDWLDGLTDHQDNLAYSAHSGVGTRIYNEFGQERLDAACRGYLTYLE